MLFELSSFTQILIGAAPALIFIAIRVLLGKGKRIVSSVVSVAALASITLSAAFFLPGFLEGLNEAEDKYVPPSVINLSETDCIDMVYALAKMGDVTAAERLLSEGMRSMAYTDGLTLAAARLAKLGGRDAVAALLYQKLGMPVEDEPDVETGRVALDAIAQAVVYAENAYDAYLASGIIDMAGAESALDGMGREERANRGIFTSDIVREARLKLLCLTGNYSEIVGNLSSSSDYKEVIIASELLMSGYVSTADFSGGFISKAEIESYKVVADTLEDAYARFWRDESREEKKRVNDAIKSYQAIAENPVIGRIIQTLTSYVESPDPQEASKTYMQLAKLQIYLGNERQAETYIDKAMEEIAGSTDEAYRAPMYELIGIITDKNDAERLKDVAHYVSEVLDNSLPIRFVFPEDYAAGSMANRPAPPKTPFTATAGADGENTNGAEAGGESGAASGGESGAASGGDNGTASFWGVNNEAGGDNNTVGDGSNNSASGGDNNTAGVGSNNAASGGDNDASAGTGNNPMPVEESSAAPAEEQGVRELTVNEKIEQSINNAVVKKRTSVKIANIDTSGFPQIEAVITLDGDISGTDDEIKDMLTVYDCGVKIEDFTVEKVNFTGANILLVCDVSGSMADYGKIAYLRDAVRSFVETKNPDESIGLVTFSSGLGMNYPIGTDADALLAASDGMRANGGTAIYWTMSNSAVLDKFAPQKDALNFIILMSDGQDNNKASSHDINEYVAGPAVSKDIVIYCLGLGSDVDANYLAMFAEFTGGAYQYADSPEQIQALFDNLRSLAQNRYLLKYSAKDTQTVNPRELKVSIETQSYASDTVYYTLDGSAPYLPEPGGQRKVAFDNKIVYGFSPSYVVKSNKDYKVELKGNGFVESESIRLFLRSMEESTAVDTSLTCKFVDEATYEVTIPAKLPIGFYALIIRIDGKESIIPKAFYIASMAGDEKFAFGPYVFTARQISNLPDGSVRLSDFVKLNGWLNFNGDLTISVKDERTAVITDNYGSYILYDKASAEGSLAKFLADKGRAVTLAPLYQLSIFNDTNNNPDDDEYETAKHDIFNIGLGLLDIVPYINLYPDRIKITTPEFGNNTLMLNLPLVDKLLASEVKNDIKTNQKGWNNFFTFSVELGGTLSGSKAGVSVDFSLDRANDRYTVFKPVTLGKQNIAINPTADIKIDTFAGDYDIKFMIDFAFLKTPRTRITEEAKNKTIGLQFVWKSDTFDSLLIYLDKELKTKIGGLDATFSKFNGGVTGISEHPDDPFKWQWTFGCSIEFAKASNYIPGLPEPFGSTAAFEFSNAQLKINLGEYYVKITTDLKVVGMKVGKAEIQAGKITYTNALLDIYQEEAWGLTVKVDASIKFDVLNVSIDIGGMAEVALTSRWCGLTIGGHLIASLNLWVTHPSVNVGGRLTVGVEISRTGELQFVLACREDGKTENAKTDDIFYLTWGRGKGGGY